jgi:hypothetical protein
MSAELANVVRARAEALTDLAWEQQETIPADLHRLARDVAELALVLARVLEGKPMLRAFGAPGDWGYGTPIGDALRVAMSDTAAQIKPQTESP